jgi:hypothetical protein
MSITSTTNKQVYDGDGGTVAFAWNHPLRAEADIEVIEYTETTGAEAVKVLTTDYTVAIADDLASATVTMNSAPASTVKLILNRKVPYTNNLQFRNHDGLLAENVAEAIDRLEMECQRLQEQVDRCLKVQIGEDSTNPDITTETELPSLTGIDTDGKFLKIASDGDATPEYTLSYESTTTANAITSGGSSTDNAIVRWDGIDGLSVQDSSVLIDDSDNITGVNNATVGGTLGVTGLSTLQSLTLASGATANEISTDGTLAGNSDTAVPTEQAVKTYIDATGSGDFSGPGSSTTNAFVRFSDGGGKTGQNSQTTEDVSGNVTVAGDLTVSGDDIYAGNGTINTDFDNNRGNTNLELIANTNETARILLQGDNNDTTASTAIVMFDDNGTPNARTLTLELGQVTDEASIRITNDNGGTSRNLITFDMANETATLTGATTFQDAITVSSGNATVTTGNLTVTAGDVTSGGKVNISGGGTAITTTDVNADDLVVGATTGNRGITISAENGVASLNFEKNNGTFIRYDEATNNDLEFKVNGGTALTIDSSQNATFDNNVTVGDGTGATKLYINGTSGTNSDIEFQEAGTPAWRIRNTNTSGGARFAIFEGTTNEYFSILGSTGEATFSSNVTVGNELLVGNSVLDSTNSFLTLGDGGVGATHNTSALTIDDNTGGAISIGVPAAGTRSIWFAGPTEVDEGQIQYQESTKRLAIGTRVAGGQVAIRTADNVTALTIDSSQRGVFESQLYVGGNTTDTTNTNFTLNISKDSTSGRLYLRDLSAGFTTGNARKDGTLIISDDGVLTFAGAKEDGSSSSTVQLTLNQNTDETTVGGDLIVDGTTNLEGLVSLTGGSYTTLGIASGVTTPTSSYHPVNTEGNAATDDMTDIVAGDDGQILIYTPFNGGRDITFKHDSAVTSGRSILLEGGTDKTFDTRNDTIMLVYNSIADTAHGSATGGWCQVAFTNNGV